jgi:hypothetical protein
LVSPRARIAIVLGCLTLAACEDLREYAGPWTGEISADPHLAHGFVAGTTISAEVTAVNRDNVALTLTLQPGGQALPFIPIRRASGDVLADVQLPGEPLRTFFGFVQPPGESPLLTVVSLFPENRLEVRLIRGADDAYGVFSLRRAPRR